MDDIFNLPTLENWGDEEDLGVFFPSMESNIDPQQQPFSPSNFGDLGDIFRQVPAHSAIPEPDTVLTEATDLVQPTILTSSLQLLNEYRCPKMNTNSLNKKPGKTVDDYQRPSTEEVMRVAGVQYINFYIPKNDYNLTMVSSPLNCSFSGMTDEEIKDVALARLLLSAADKIGNQQFDRGRRLLNQCANLSSDTGSSVLRVVYYFSQALQERIGRETAKFSSEGRWKHASAADVEETVLTPNSASLDCHRLLPFCQINMCASVQAIVESLGLAKRVHLIDLGLRSGIPWTMLMQALAARKESTLEILKISAVCTSNEREVQATGKMLTSFAESMGVRFSFTIVMVPNMEDIEEELFELEDDESVVVYAGFVLRTMLATSGRLDWLMDVIKNLNPCIMIVAEVEGSHNSMLFFKRFTECLFYFSAFFDCLETCMERNSQNRMKIEAFYLGEAIVNIVAMEGEERVFRNVGIDMWRSFFARFKMVEKDFSYSSMYQANLIKEQCAQWSSCTLDRNGKCIIVKWKGTPLESLSAWEFL